MTDLSDRVVMVTGGAQGLGEAIVRVLGAAGMRTVVADVNEARADELVTALRQAGQAADCVQLDVTDAESAERGVRQVIERHGRLDVLVNNAGVDVTKPVDELTLDEWDRVMAVNLRGPFVMARLALAHMAAQGRGHILNITSTAAKRAWANASVYHASKWGLLGFSHALFVEARQQNVKVTAIVAGGMRTPFILDRFPEVDLNVLQDPRNVAETIKFVLSQPPETVIPELMVLPLNETSWP